MALNNNVLRDYFVPSCCQNDWQRCPSLHVGTYGDFQIVTISYQGSQTNFRVESFTSGGEDAFGYDCVIQCQYADAGSRFTRHDRCKLTWALLFVEHYGTPAEIGFHTRHWPEYSNKASYELHAAEAEPAWEDFGPVPELFLPPMPPQFIP